MSKKKKEAPGFHTPFSALDALKKKLEDDAAKSNAPPKPAVIAPAAPPPPPSTPGDEAEVFHRLMSGVVPLDQKRGRVAKSVASLERGSVKDAAVRKAEALAAVAREAEEVHERLRALVDGDGPFEVQDDGTRVEGRRHDVRPDMLRRLRRGLLPIDARLDLHGLRAGEAAATVAKFLAEKRARGERCALVVHGKGLHSPRGDGVLRGEMAAWLSQGAASEHVAAFATATEHDGGEGAIYVLLRR